MGRPMKDSGVEWIGEIPDDWELFKVNNLFFISRGRVISKEELSDTGQYPVYSSQTKNNGVLGYINEFDYDTPQLTWTTDGANAGTVFLRDGKYNCTNVCGILKPKRNTFNLSFLKYSLEYTAIHHKRADTNGYKIMSNEMAQIMLAIPGIEQQEKITTLIDQKTTHIDSIIEKTKASIAAFKRYKQALITETVTKGLNPDVPMKDSGIEWIGMIPAYWEVRKMKTLGTSRNGLTYSPDEVVDDREGTLVLRSSNVQNGRISLEDTVYVAKEVSKSLMVEKGDILICSRNGSRKLIGKNAIIEGNMVASFGAFMMIFKSNQNSKYLYYILNSEVFNFYLGTFLSSTINQLTKNNFQNMEVVFCANNKEQEKIVAFLDEKTAHIDRLIQNKEAMIEKLEAYKKSLIYEYVTGKKEVE